MRHLSLWILIGVTLIFASPLFLRGFFENHDSITHLARAAQYILAFQDLQIPPRWAPTVNYGHGSPFFILYYPLTGYSIAFLYSFKLTLEQSYVLFSIITFFLGPLTFYLWIKNKFNSNVALMSSLIYLFLPYRYLTLFVRGGIGEFLSFSLLPLCFYFFDRWVKTKSKKYLLWEGIVLALVVLSHNAIGFLGVLILFVYASLYGKRMFIGQFFVTLLTFGLSAYFWIPSIVETKYTTFHFYFGTMFKDHFPKIQSLIVSPWGFGADVNKDYGLSPQVGIIGCIVIIFSLILFVLKKYNKKDKQYILFWIILFLIGFFISSEYSSFIWEKSRALQRFQFPWRFIFLPSFAVAVLSAYIFSFKNLHNSTSKKIILVVCFLMLGVYSWQFTITPKGKSFGDSYYFSYPGSTYYHGEGTTIWSAGDPSREAKSQIELIGGKGKVSNLVKKSTVHSFILVGETSLIVLDNTVYFPGWSAYVDGKKIPIQYQDPSNRGLITFNVTPGEHSVVVKFEETKIRLISNLITIMSLIILGGIAIKEAFKKKN